MSRLVEAWRSVLNQTTVRNCEGNNRVSLSVLTDIFPGESVSASFIGVKDNGSSGDSRSYKTHKPTVKGSPPTNHATRTNLPY